MAPRKGAPSTRELQKILDKLDELKNEEADKIFEVEQNMCLKHVRVDVFDKENTHAIYFLDYPSGQFLNHPLVCDLLTDDDQKILKYLILFDVDDYKDKKSGYSYTEISPNPYFEDACLRKTYIFHDDGIVTITGATIKWKEGMYTGNDDIREKNDCKKVSSHV
uniref:NAP1-related protein 2-like n=1 Tax=Ananas comosus var. bracteatus TaxID=296719 RepID=A0A6V7QS75_ANACO